MEKLYGLKLDGIIIAVKRVDYKPDPWNFPIPSWKSYNDYEVVELTDEDLDRVAALC